MRKKQIKANTKHRSGKVDSCCADSVENSISRFEMEYGFSNVKEDSDNNISLNSNAHPYFNAKTWCYSNDEELEEMLLNNLEFLYTEAISKLVASGYDQDTVLKAIFQNGHCYGGMSALFNIVSNSLAYLHGDVNVEETRPAFTDLRQLAEYSLSGMVDFIEQARPELSKSDVLLCLLMTDLNVVHASAFQKTDSCVQEFNNVEGTNDNLGGVTPDLCRFHGGWGFGCGSSEFESMKEVDSVKKFNTKASMKAPLKGNGAMCASGYRAKSKQVQLHSQACPIPSSNSDLLGNSEAITKQSDEFTNGIRKLHDSTVIENLDGMTDDEKDKMIQSLCDEIKYLEQKVSDRKAWAQDKALQAARKLSHDLGELKMLRREREEMQSVRKGKLTLADTTLKRLYEMESALRKASSEVNRANTTVRWLHAENAEIRAEMEAYKLSTSENISACLEAAKREKRSRKKLVAWEKQKAKLQEQIAEERRKTSVVRQEIDQIDQANRELEVQCREESTAKELAETQVEMKQRLKEAAEAENKRRYEALRLKCEMDSQRCKDDLQRLERERSHLKSSLHPAETQHFPNNRQESEEAREGMIAQLLNELERLEVSSDKKAAANRNCFLCGNDEVSVLFLPCAHEVLCFRCSDPYGKKENPLCPCCHSPIEEKVRVFGPSS